MNQREKVIQYLLSLERDTKNTVCITRELYKQSGLEISERDFMRELDALEKSNYIIKSNLVGIPKEDLEYATDVEFLSPMLKLLN